MRFSACFLEGHKAVPRALKDRAYCLGLSSYLLRSRGHSFACLGCRSQCSPLFDAWFPSRTYYRRPTMTFLNTVMRYCSCGAHRSASRREGPPVSYGLLSTSSINFVGSLAFLAVDNARVTLTIHLARVLQEPADIFVWHSPRLHVIWLFRTPSLFAARKEPQRSAHVRSSARYANHLSSLHYMHVHTLYEVLVHECLCIHRQMIA